MDAHPTSVDALQFTGVAGVHRAGGIPAFHRLKNAVITGIRIICQRCQLA